MSTTPPPSQTPLPPNAATGSAGGGGEGGVEGKKEGGSAFRDTLNLPRTPFAMKANLVQNEPASIKRWAGMDLYGLLRERRKGAARFVFHDGPPYANGSIHLGHLMNKVLKDMVVRSKTMAGLDCPFVIQVRPNIYQAQGLWKK